MLSARTILHIERISWINGYDGADRAGLSSTHRLANVAMMCFVANTAPGAPMKLLILKCLEDVLEIFEMSTSLYLH